jgi:hypothetical protein
MRWILLLLISVTLFSCEKQKEPFVINWDKGKAVSVSVKRSLFAKDVVPDVRVSGSEYKVLGKAEVGDETIRLIPEIPFQRGQTYEVIAGTDKVLSFAIPLDTSVRPPQVVASFPSCDSIPENLLKIYLMFDQPMMEGRAYNFIHLFDQTTGDTIKGAFLDLQPELWSEDQTVLTLWLDPGRIKQDLIPNQKLGAVLNKNSHYELRVSPGWKSKSGLPMSDAYERHFVTKDRDTVKPDMMTWQMDTDQVFKVETGESLDWSLLNSVISAWREDDKEIAGTVVTDPCEKGFRFVPLEPWPKGKNRIVIESRLEDLAGNNLNRLFETDITEPTGLFGNERTRVVYFVVH